MSRPQKMHAPLPFTFKEVLVAVASRRPAFKLVNQLRTDAAAIGANDGQAVASRADGTFVARQRTAVFCDELCDLHLFVRGQFFDLLNDFKRTHGLIIRYHLLLASRIALRLSIPK